MTMSWGSSQGSSSQRRRRVGAVGIWPRVALLVGSLFIACGEPELLPVTDSEPELVGPNPAQPALVPLVDTVCRMGFAQHPPRDLSHTLVESSPGSAGFSVTYLTAADSLPGELGVTSGQATYTLPLQLPIGINGMIPSLQLTYTST